MRLLPGAALVLGASLLCGTTVAPPLPDVMAGASFWLVTVTTTAWVSVRMPSEAWTITS